MIKTPITILTLILICLLGTAQAQTFTPYPSPPRFEGNNAGLNLNAEVYNGKLYMQYRSNTDNYRMLSFDGSSFDSIPNPPGHDGVFKGFQGKTTVYNGIMYVTYRNDSNELNIYTYNGTVLSLLQPPTGYTAFTWIAATYGSKLYFRGTHTSGRSDLIEFDGTNFNPFPSPSGFTAPGAGFTATATEANGELILGYLSNAGIRVIRVFNGSGFNTVFPSSWIQHR